MRAVAPAEHGAPAGESDPRLQHLIGLLTLRYFPGCGRRLDRCAAGAKRTGGHALGFVSASAIQRGSGGPYLTYGLATGERLITGGVV